MKYLLPIAIMACMLACDPVGEDPDPGVDRPGLVAWFPLDSSFLDASGNDVVLQAHGEPEFMEGHDQEPFAALLLDGEDDYLVASIGGLDTFSISMWIRSYRYFVGEWPHRRSTVFDYSIKQSYAFIDGTSGATQLNFGIASEAVADLVPDNMYHWFHLYVAVDDELKIYHNGLLGTSVPVGAGLEYESPLLYLGRASEGEELELSYLHGMLDEIRIYDGILSQADIIDLQSEFKESKNK